MENYEVEVEQKYAEKDKILEEKRKDLEEERAKIQREIAEGNKSTKRTAMLVIFLTIGLSVMFHLFTAV